MSLLRGYLISALTLSTCMIRFEISPGQIEARGVSN